MCSMQMCHLVAACACLSYLAGGSQRNNGAVALNQRHHLAFGQHLPERDVCDGVEIACCGTRSNRRQGCALPPNAIMTLRRRGGGGDDVVEEAVVLLELLVCAGRRQ